VLGLQRVAKIALQLGKSRLNKNVTKPDKMAETG
jgi:hypothetical protein